jgi:aromatic ring-opening dioxygenase catalytic subunit (LigB family)
MNTIHLCAFHIEPQLIWPKEHRPASTPLDAAWGKFGPDGTLAQFLQDFGKTVLSKYKPRAIAVFSAHWETHGETLGEH